MTAMETNDPAPDWAALAGELHCPLCQYNLRGLERPRCPECGFAFSWSEIVRGQKEKHPYLFEHQDRRNIWSFWKTYWADCRPRKFWSELSPAQPVNLRRLMIYWFVASLILFASPVTQFGFSVWDISQSPFFMRGYPYRFTARGPVPISVFTPFTPASPPTFTVMDSVKEAWDHWGDDLRRYPIITGSLTILAWPWVTLLSLLVFSQSMRRAKILKRHVLRVVIYGTEFGFLLLILLCVGRDFRYGSGWPLFVALVCSAVTLYRVYFGYARYLRFHMPLATVLASQMMVFLLFAVVYFQTVQRW